MLRAAMGKVDSTQEQKGNVSTETEILRKNKVWYYHAMEYYAAIKRSALLTSQQGKISQ